jgi:hypothetical protein
MGQEDMIDARQIRYRQIPDPGAGIDQNIVVDEQRRGPQVLAADTAATAEDSQFHRHLIANVASPSSSGRLLRMYRIFSGNTAYCLHLGYNRLRLYNFVPASARSLHAKQARGIMAPPRYGICHICLAGPPASRRAEDDGRVSRTATGGGYRR